MFRQAGIIQVDTLDEMFDVAQLIAHQPLPTGSRVAIVGNSDALGLLADRRGGRQRPDRHRGHGPRCRRDGRRLRARPGRRHRRRPRRRRGRGLHPAPGRRWCRGRQRARGRGGAVGQAAGLHLPRPRGRARAAARPRPRPATRPDAARCRRTPRSRRRCVPWRGSWSTPRGGSGTTREDPAAVLDGIDLEAAARQVEAAAAPRRPTGATSTTPSCASCSGTTASTSGSGCTSRRRRRRSRPASGSAGTSCSRRRRSGCASGPTSPTCGATSRTPRRCRWPGRRCAR